MLMQYSDDPIADFDAWERANERELAKLPSCCECGEPITERYCYEINGEYVCRHCMDDNHKKYVDDLIE